MIHLNPNTAKIILAKNEFHQGMQNFVFERLDMLESSTAIYNGIAQSFFINNINPYIDDILVGTPEQLIEINQRVNPYIKISENIRKCVEYVFNYEIFIHKAKRRYDAYNLSQALDVSTCPYCNRNYTNTVIRDRDHKKITRPQFDHYFDKASNPLLAVSFFNLIPSCSVCNASIKGSQNINLENYLHPYIDNELDAIKFTYKFTPRTKSGLEVKVVTINGSKAHNTMSLFAIEEVYNSHTGELSDLLKIRQYFSDRYLNILASNLLNGIITSRDELYRIVFNTEIDATDFINRPFSKFKHDILSELGVL